jgi:hypothetical protein
MNVFSSQQQQNEYDPVLRAMTNRQYWVFKNAPETMEGLRKADAIYASVKDRLESKKTGN